MYEELLKHPARVSLLYRQTMSSGRSRDKLTRGRCDDGANH